MGRLAAGKIESRIRGCGARQSVEELADGLVRPCNLAVQRAVMAGWVGDLDGHKSKAHGQVVNGNEMRLPLVMVVLLPDFRPIR